MTSADPRVQLRFTYQPPSKALRLRGELRGVFVELEPEDGDLQAAQAYLQYVGAQSRSESSCVLLPAEDVGLLLALPEQVVLLPDQELSTLLRCLGASVVPPVVVSLDSPQLLNLNWIDETGECNEPLNVRSVAALLASRIPLSASPDTWEMLVSARALPSSRTRARLNLDGFVEITVTIGRQIESAGVPGLFKIDTGRYGVPAALSDDVLQVPGVFWEGPKRFTSDRVVPADSLPLGPHSAPLLPGFLHTLELSRAAVVHSPPGSGRRLFSLAACESLRATPVTVVCRPACLWLWHRHIDLLGSGGEVTIISYDALEHVRIPASSAVIFDDLDLALRERPTLQDAVHRFDGIDAEYKIAVLRGEPMQDAELLTVLSVVRPAEFTTRVPLPARYPGDATARFREHAGVFLHGLPRAQDPIAFKSSSVQEVMPGSRLLEVFAAVTASSPPPARQVRTRAAELMAWASAGTESVLGPKIAAVLTLGLGEGSAVVTRFPRTAQILSDLGAFSRGAVLVDPVSSPGDLSRYARVVLLEPPFSYRELDRSVVEASDSAGTREVVVLHSPGTPDDRAAEVSFRRRGLEDQAFTGTEAAFIAGLIDYREFFAHR